MAEHNEVAYTTADGNDYPAHEQTYEGFIMLVKYGSAAVIFILALAAGEVSEESLTRWIRDNWPHEPGA